MLWYYMIKRLRIKQYNCVWSWVLKTWLTSWGKCGSKKWNHWLRALDFTDPPQSLSREVVKYCLVSLHNSEPTNMDVLNVTGCLVLFLHCKIVFYPSNTESSSIIIMCFEYFYFGKQWALHLMSNTLCLLALQPSNHFKMIP